jgi:hypothetical protein
VHSPLELDEELVHALGLVSARWSALEIGLADLLGRFLRVDHAGEAALFALSSFSQRLNLVKAVASYSLESERDLKIVSALLEKIERLWLKRNLFVHSHYIHRSVHKDGIEVSLVGDGGAPFGPDAISDDMTKVLSRSFGYGKRKRDGETEFVPVNLGTFRNHAHRVAQRGRQVMAVVKALDTGIARLRKDAPTSYGRLSPRSPVYANTPPKIGAFTSRVMPKR